MAISCWLLTIGYWQKAKSKKQIAKVNVRPKAKSK